MTVWLLSENTSSNPYVPNWQLRGVFADYPANDHSKSEDAENWRTEEWEVSGASDANS
jgi:hypothetical protein